MKALRSIIGVLVFGLLSALAQAQQACYLPTQNNVSFKSITELATSSPLEVIAYGKDSLQFGELWIPTEVGDPELSSVIKHPLVILIHGGCWLNEYDISHTHALSTGLANAGYAVWSIEYRRYGDAGGGWPGSYQDITRAIQHVEKLADYPIDLSSIALVGHSAGGHLALLAGSGLEVRGDAPISVQVVIGLAPIVDIETYARGDNSCQIATPKFIGGTPQQVPSKYAAANPSRKTLHPNSHALHGDLDQIVSLSQSKNSQLKLQVIEGAGHFDHVHPGTPAFQALLKLLAKEL